MCSSIKIRLNKFTRKSLPLEFRQIGVKKQTKPRKNRQTVWKIEFSVQANFDFIRILARIARERVAWMIRGEWLFLFYFFFQNECTEWHSIFKREYDESIGEADWRRPTGGGIDPRGITFAPPRHGSNPQIHYHPSLLPILVLPQPL